MVKVGAMAVSCDFCTFMILGALIGVCSLAYGALGPTGWSFKCIKAWDSTLAHPAKVVLPVSNLMCCFNIPFSLSTKLAACGLEGRWNLHSISCSLPSLAPLKCDPNHCLFNEGVHT